MCAYRPVVPLYPSQSQGQGGAFHPSFIAPSSVSLRRPFRHRRKDPSCDACRERKVKCDAAGTSSCSECRTRNIKCQFTRDNMRRLTSMKQVQDLERKLRTAKLEVSNLQSQMQRQRLAALDESEWSESSWRRNSSESDIRDPLKAFDFQRIRQEIIRRSPGLFNVPPAWRETVPDLVSDGHLGSSHYQPDFRPVLPDRFFVDYLLHLFTTEVFAISPTVPLEEFSQEVRQMYDSEHLRDDNGIPLNASRSWLAFFFAVLAFTAQCIQDDIIFQHYSTEEGLMPPNARDLAESAAYFLGPITKKNTLDDVRGSLALSLYYNQLNEISAAHIWLGLACKIAQNLGCHRYSPGLSRAEEEARAKVWWDIYLMDRMFAGQQGYEMAITDSDCDLPPPENASTFPLPEPESRVALHAKLYSWAVLHARVVRLLRDSSFLSPEEIEKLDEKINAQYEKMPTSGTINTEFPNNQPWYLDNHIFLHNTKFRVCRHNLTPNGPLPLRMAALHRCIDFAKEASDHIRELFKDEDEAESKEEAKEYNRRVIRILYPEHCHYLLSSAMYLVVAKLWTLALPLVKALRTIGDKLPLNKCCCRYLWGVIIWAEGRDSILGMANRAKEGQLADEDEEILALVAADMHQDARAWEAVWQKDDDKKPPTFDMSPMSEEMELEHTEDLVSVSETSDVRSGASFKTSAVTSEGDQLQHESEIEIEVEMVPRPVLSNQWSGEDESWDSMLKYIREKSDEERQMEDIKSAEVANVTTGMSLTVASAATLAPTDEDTIQRRMSIHNFL